MNFSDETVSLIAQQMARVFTSREDADRVLRATKYTSDRAPVFANFPAPISFWLYTCRELAKGVIPNGLRALWAAAAAEYPDSFENFPTESDVKTSHTGATGYAQRYRRVQHYLDSKDFEHRRLLGFYREHRLPHYLRPTDAYNEEQQGIAAEYFKLLSQGLELADKADVRFRLDVYLYLMDASLGELRCSFLFEQFQLAAATPGFHRTNADVLANVLMAIRRCVVEHLDCYTLPPFFHPRLRKRLRTSWFSAVDTPDILNEAQNGFLRILWATRLIDGSDYPEAELVTAIDRILRTSRSVGLPPRLVALLHYRRCLSHIYLGQWIQLSDELAGSITYVDAWDPNWTAFLQFQLGRVGRSVNAYAQATKSRDGDVSSLATYSLHELLPATHSPFVVKENDYFSAFEAELARDAELSEEISRSAHISGGRRRGLNREHRLEFLLDLAARTHKATVRRALEESGRGITFGDSSPRTDIMQEFQRFWMQGVPPLRLRDDRVEDAVKCLLQDDPLPSVLELNLVVDILHRWEPGDLREAAERFSRQNSLGAWQDLVAEQAARLCRLVEFFVSERRIGFGPTCAREERQFDQVFRRIRCGISFFAGLADYLPSRILLPLGRICVQLIRYWSVYWVLSREERQGWDTLTWLAIQRTGQSPEQMGIEPQRIADILAGRMDGKAKLASRWLEQNSHKLSARYKRLLERARTQPSRRRRSSPIELTESSSATLSNRALSYELVAHWGQWRENGFKDPPFVVAKPLSDNDGEDCYYHSFVQPGIESLALALRVAEVHPLAQRWLSRGIYGLAELALRFSDTDRWMLLFEATSAWSRPWESFGCSLHVVRAACERPSVGPGLRVRILERILGSQGSHEWLDLLLMFEQLLLAAENVYVDDILTLRYLSAGADPKLDSLHVLRLYITLLKKLLTCSPVVGVYEMLSRSVSDITERILALGLLPWDGVELVRRFIAQVDALPQATQQRLSEQNWRPVVERARRWIDAHGYGI